jgi:hypothetical protein
VGVSCTISPSEAGDPSVPGTEGWVVTTVESTSDRPTSAKSTKDLDWPIIVAGITAFVILVYGVIAYVMPHTESGRFDRCVQQRAEVLEGKSEFPVIPAVAQCTVLRDAGALG